MEQPDPVAVKTREFVVKQLGEMVLRLCEVEAVNAALAERNKALEEQAHEKAGSE